VFPVTPLDFTALAQLALAVLVVAAVGATVALVAVTSALVGHRRLRLTRHQTVRTYYRGLALSH
jgi:hypothetical protein